MRFNMINWLTETVSLILVMFVENVFLNILLNSCGTPLVIYFHLFCFMLTNSFLRFTFWVLRKTGSLPGSTSCHAFKVIHEK